MTNGSIDETEQAYAQALAYGRDLARLYAAEKVRRKEFETTNQKLQAIFDTVPNGLAVVDNDLAIVEVNPRFLTLFEQTEACLGQPLSLLLPVENLLAAMRAFEVGTIESDSVEVEVRQPVPRSLLVNFSRLTNQQGWVLILHDLTERGRLEGLKSEFINIAAHELRTPLAGVIGFASVLQESFRRMDNATVEELIELILQSTERLKMIVDELVDFAAIHREPRDDLHVVDVDLYRLLQKSFKMLEQQITAKNILYSLELPDAPFIIRGDQLILGEVIYHLLDNAVSFNKPDGQVIVRANRLAASSKQGAGVTVIEIEDTGIGIPQAELGKIFDKFYQVEEHMTRTVGGLGLGLTIARQGVERHGGRLTVTSQLGQGSIFQIILPAITEHSDVSIDDRADMAHQQTLAYAKDMARAVVDQRRMTQKMKQVNRLSTNLQSILDKLAEVGSREKADQEALEHAQQIIQEMLKLSDQGLSP